MRGFIAAKVFYLALTIGPKHHAERATELIITAAGNNHIGSNYLHRFRSNCVVGFRSNHADCQIKPSVPLHFARTFTIYTIRK